MKGVSITKRFLFCAVLVFLPALTQAAERFELEAYASRFDSIPIGIVNLTPTNNNRIRENFPWDILANNLDFSGRFGVLQRPEFDSAFFHERGIGIFVDGSYTLDGSNIQIEFVLRDVGSQTPLITKRYRGEVKFLRNMVHRYSNELVEMLFSERGIFESRFLYVRTQGQNKNIAVMDFDGHNRSMLTNNNTINIFPVFADKSTVVWTSYQRGKPDLYRGSITEGTSRIFIQDQAMAVSPDVSSIDGVIAFASSRSGSLNIFTAAPDGSRQRQLTFSRGIDTAPNWSPNGYQIAFTSDRAGGPQIFIMDAAGANQRRVTFEGRYNDMPAWSPKGDRIAYVSRADGGQFNIWTINPDGSDAKMIADVPGINESPTWSPDGTLIAFANKRGGRSDLFVVRADGTRLRKITNTGDVQMPRWSGF
jgi:TolB protein